MIDTKDWIEQKLKEQRRLYEQYGEALEKDHTGSLSQSAWRVR